MTLRNFKILLSSLIFLTLSTRAEVDYRWKDLIVMVNKELAMLKNTPNNAKIEFKKLELYSEKLKLVHEWDNHIFLEHVKNKLPHKEKKEFFKRSFAQYNMTKNYGFSLLKKNKNHAFKNHIYIVLGLNSRDYSNDQLAEKYLAQAVAQLKNDKSDLKPQATSALAELYFNEKRFVESAALYEKVVSDKSNPWLSKNNLNLAWCYLKLRRYEEATHKIVLAYNLSKNPKYVKVDEQILENLGSFFVVAGKPIPALNFYLKNTADPISHLISLAQKSSEKGYSKETAIILNKTRQIIEARKANDKKEAYLHATLDYHRQYNNFPAHFSTAGLIGNYYKEVETSKLPQESKDDFLSKIRTVAGFLQVKLVKDMKEDKSQYNKNELQYIQGYFDLLVKLDPSKKHEYLYYKGETFYSVKEYKSAALAYKDSVLRAQEIKDIEYSKKPLNSLLVLTSQLSPTDEFNKQLLVFSYHFHIKFWPKDEKSQIIYPKLFSMYHSQDDDKKAAGILTTYHKYFPGDLKIQQSLMGQMINRLIEKKDSNKLVYWVTKIKSGYLEFDSSTVSKAEVALGNILFLQNQALAKNGKKSEAKTGFAAIYKDGLYSAKIKSQAAFFTSMAALEEGNTKESYNWMKLANALMTPAERTNTKNDTITISERSYYLQDFHAAFQIAHESLQYFCPNNSKEDRFFEIAIMTSLIEENSAQAESIVEKFKDCLTSQKTAEVALAQIFQHYEKQRDVTKLDAFVQKFFTQERNDRFIEVAQNWYWRYPASQTEVAKALKNNSSNRAMTWVKNLHELKVASDEMDKMKKTVLWNAKTFDPDLFNKNLETHLASYQSFRDKYQHLTLSKDLHLAISATQLFSLMYKDLGSRISELNPAGLEATTAQEFRNAMKGLSSQFMAAAKKYDDHLNKETIKNENVRLSFRSLASKERPFNFGDGILMDQEGTAK